MDEKNLISQEKEKNHILLEPVYYEKFHCLADRCHYDCCHSWKITIPKGDYSRIRSCRKSREMEKLVEEGIVRNKRETDNTFYARMNLKENGDCVFLNEDRLCRLQMECGYRVLPEVCKTFPRRVFLYGNLIERSCSSGCEEVVNMLWNLQSGIEFVEKPVTGIIFGQAVTENIRKKLIFRHFYEIQKLTIQILQNKGYNLGGRIILLGMAIRELSALEGNQEAADETVEAWLKKYRVFAAGNHYAETLARFPQNSDLFMVNNITTAEAVARSIDLEYKKVLGTALEALQVKRNENRVTVNRSIYQEAKKKLEDFIKGNEYLLENLLVNQWFFFGAPLDSEGVWYSYIRFCVLYSQLLTILIGNILNHPEKDSIVHMITVWSRLFLHNKSRLNAIIQELIRNQSDTLAHMAILVNG